MYIPINVVQCTYSILNENGFIHKTANDLENVFDLKTGAKTQSIETLWRHLKNKYNIKTPNPINSRKSCNTQYNLKKICSNNSSEV